MDRNVVYVDRQSQYLKFNWRARHLARHTTAVVGEVLYCWGGSREGLDVPHCSLPHCDSAIKRECTSAIDAFNLLSGVWSSQPTRGTPPLGIIGVSCTTINNNIYYFGGYCGHDSCFHNSLNCLDTLTLQWNELQPTTGDNSVTKRGYGGMIAMGSEGEPQQLLVIGGFGPLSTSRQYIPSQNDRFRTNEHNIYNLFSGQWIVPSVSGQCFPPTTYFIIERINYNKGIMYGGGVTVDGGGDITTNSIYLFQLSHNTINWECLKQGSVPNDGLWPKGRAYHASTIINGVSTSPTLVVIGGVDSWNQSVNECLLLDTNQYNWMKIPLPDSVTGRYCHTVSSFVVDPNHVFLIIVGGVVKSEQKDVGGGVMKWFDTPVTDPNITMVVELVFNDGQWSVGPVLDSYTIPLFYEHTLKERKKELIEKYIHMTDKVKELQVIIESLRHENQSLQEALRETSSLSVSTAATLMEKDEMIQRLESQLQETEKQLVPVTKIPVYGAKVIELEDQDIKVKQIHLEDQVIVKKNKMMDVTLHEHDQFSIKGTNSVGVSLSEVSSDLAGNSALFQQQQGVKELASTENRSKEFKAEKYAGLVYYEEKGVGDVVTFTAAKNLNALLEFILKEHPQATIGPCKYFHIASPDGFVEFNLNAPQEEPFTGWSIKPHIKPCRLYQDDIKNFGKEDYPLPPSCLISVYSSPDAVPTLHYSVPVEGVADPVTLYIQISRRTAHPIEAAPSGSGSDEAIPVPTKRRREGGFDIKTAKQKIKQVMNENHSDFADILESSLKDIANKLFEAKIVSQQVQKSPTYDAIASSFLSLMKILNSKSALEKHCMTFLEALSSVGGPIECVAKCLQEKWTAALEGALQFEQSVKRARTNDE